VARRGKVKNSRTWGTEELCCALFNSPPAQNSEQERRVPEGGWEEQQQQQKSASETRVKGRKQTGNRLQPPLNTASVFSPHSATTGSSKMALKP